ncbi:SLOG family protein [Micromonospora sp. NPDC049101]|uniref:SLOG family protein n=1 Tax=Micromonospora sp. NPDC049101 TaxID=3155032 RepID=UPI0033D3EE69
MRLRRVLITGSRDWQDSRVIGNALLDVRDSLDWTGHDGQAVTLVSGVCPTGADYMAELFALDLRWTIERHPADWKAHGKRAGYIRNARMVNLGADLCLAFIRNGSRGASMTADMARRAGIQTWIYREVVA